MALVSLPFAGGPGCASMPVEGLFLWSASIQAQIIMKGISTKEQ